MKIKKRYRLLIVATSLFIADFGLTWYFLTYTPYVREGNSLFSIDGGYLSLVANLIYLIIAFLIGLKIERYDTVIVEARNSFDYFKKLFTMDRTDFIYISYLTAFIYATFASRLSVVMDWIIFGIYQETFFSTQYSIIRNEMPFGRVDIVVALLSFLLFSILWYSSEFRKSKKILARRKKIG